MSIYDRQVQIQSDSKKIYGNSIAIRIPKYTFMQMPTPTYISEDSKGIVYIYGYEQTTPNYQQFQVLNTIKVNIQNKLRDAVFEDGIEVEKGNLYTINQLYRLFDCEFIKYKLPLLPKNKKDFQSKLSIYAQAMHYERRLHLEIVLFATYFFNSKLPISQRFKYRELFKKALTAYYYVDKTKDQKLNKAALHYAHAKGAKMTNVIKKEEQAKKAAIMHSYLQSCTKNNGKVDFEKLSSITVIPKSTLYKLYQYYPIAEESKEIVHVAIMRTAHEKKSKKIHMQSGLSDSSTSTSLMPTANEIFLKYTEV